MRNQGVCGLAFFPGALRGTSSMSALWKLLVIAILAFLGLETQQSLCELSRGGFLYLCVCVFNFPSSFKNTSASMSTSF